MIRSTPKRSLFFPAAMALAATASCWSPAAFAHASDNAATSAEAVPASPDTVRLTDAERDAILNSNTAQSAAIVRGEQAEPETIDRGIHGEVSAMIGSNGTRGIAGTAAIPLGDNAGAVVSFESSRFGYPARR